ncbi:MAG: hypothetical protein WA756_22845 [Pseudolabrys sp.]|jgi:hypothetical protein
MSGNHAVSEWNLLREQFHALVREGSDNIEDILDAEFRRRFSEVINLAAKPDNFDRDA